MKRLKNVLIGLFVVAAGYGTWSVAQILPRETFLSSRDAKMKWGQAPFDAARFKEGGPQQRAKMAFAMLENSKPFVGKTVPELREMLGEQTGYYRRDMFPAYLIEEGKVQGDESWQILFLLGDQYRVREVRLHKNCCYN